MSTWAPIWKVLPFFPILDSVVTSIELYLNWCRGEWNCLVLEARRVTMNDSKIENRLRRMELSLAKCCNDASRPRDFFKNKAVDHSTTVLWMLLDEYIKEKVFSYKECGGHVARPNYRGLWLAVIRARKRDWWACWSVRFPVADGSESSWYISITASAAELFL